MEEAPDLFDHRRVKLKDISIWHAMVTASRDKFCFLNLFSTSSSGDAGESDKNFLDHDSKNEMIISSRHKKGSHIDSMPGLRVSLDVGVELYSVVAPFWFTMFISQCIQSLHLNIANKEKSIDLMQ